MPKETKKRAPRRTKKVPTPLEQMIIKTEPEKPVIATLDATAVQANLDFVDANKDVLTQEKLFADKNAFMRAHVDINGDDTALIVKICTIPIIWHAARLAMYIPNFITYIENNCKQLVIKVNDPRFEEAVKKLAAAQSITWPGLFVPSEFANIKTETAISAKDLTSPVDEAEELWPSENTVELVDNNNETSADNQTDIDEE